MCLLVVENMPYGNRHTSGTIPTTTLQFIYNKAYIYDIFSALLKNQSDELFNPTNASKDLILRHEKQKVLAPPKF